MGLVSSYSAVCYAVPALACPPPIDILTRPEARSFPAEPLEDSPSHMAADLRQTILGDLRIIINDVWDFFAPPLIKFSIALFFFWYICGSAPFYAFNDSVANTASFWDATKITNFFEQYKLTSLLPIAALFVVAIFAYTINRIIFGVAALLPVNIGYSSDRIERMIQEDAMMQKHLESFSPFSGYMLVNFALAKARSQKEEALLRSVDSLEKQMGRDYNLFSFAKFLLVWTITCGVLSLTISSATAFTYSRLSLLTFTVIVFGIYAASKHAKSLEYLGYAQVEVVRQMVIGQDYLTEEKLTAEKRAVVDGSTEVQSELKKRRDQERQMRIEYLKRSDWWFLSLRLMDWWEILGHFRHYDPGYIRSDPRLLLQALLRNSVNIWWFIIGWILINILGKFSWWLGVGLFIGYVSITIVDCLLIVLLIGAVSLKSLRSSLISKLPEVITDFLPPKPERAIEVSEDGQYRITVAAVRLVEAVLALMLCRALATHFLG